MIELKNIHKIFEVNQQQIHAVNGVNLTIQDGEIFGIIGYSGAGKSTLIRIINQLEKQTSGDVIIDGENINHLSEKELRKKRMKMGMIFQHFNLLWSRSVSQNIEFPLEIAGVEKSLRKKKVQELISLVGLEGREDAYPSELSGGQKQRVGIARALANDPTILLCDEATSALDPDTTQSILDLLVEINQKLHLTIVLITHQMEVVQKICHRIAVMSDGKVVELNDVKSIFEKPCHEVTKRFIQDVNGHDNMERIKKELTEMYPNSHILCLNFSTDISNSPILANVIRKTNVDVSIVNSSISHSMAGPLGSMYICIDGDYNEYQKFVQYLKDEHVKVEVFQ
ncbi:MAG: methionine ABC transporter ATP-binding protein [Traorella sp.]